MSLFKLVIKLCAWSLCVSLVSCYPQLQQGWKKRQLKSARQVSKLYDYIVVGGGQSGLVVANRLSENSNVTVLVVEYGYFDDSPAQLQPQSASVWPPRDLFNLSSTPQTGLGGRVQSVLSASVVGGGSTINGMFLNRGSARDYDNWGKLNNDSSWTWNGIQPYFVKSSTFDEPSPTLKEEFNITWDPSAYGHGPIHNSFAPYQWLGAKPQWKGFTEVGLQSQIDGQNGNAYGVFWVPAAIDNATITRSYARNGYYDPIANRTNLQLLTGYRVNEVLFDETKHAYGITVQARSTPDATNVTVISAHKEIVLTAGALHSPQILQRSGIGPSSLLRKANISVVVDLPGVGSNLQDHPVASVRYNYAKNISPNPDTANNNATFVAWANQEWTQYRRGPYSRTVGNTAALVPLKVVAPSAWQGLVTAYERQNASQYLPASYTTEQIRGYEAQRALLADSFSHDDNAVLEIPFSGSTSFALVLIKPTSRGTILINSTNKYAEPILDYYSFSNPADVSNTVNSVRFTRRYHTESQTMVQTFNATELAPGTSISSDTDLERYLRSSTSSSTAHLSGTCALTPRSLGGVVGVDLTVYGVTGLSVADASIMPLIPAAHTCSTVYAVAEKAADIIKSRHR